MAEVVHTSAPPRVVAADPDDDPVIQTAVLGTVEVLCTRDTHFQTTNVREYCAQHGIRVLNDIELYQILTGRPIAS